MQDPSLGEQLPPSSQQELQQQQQQQQGFNAEDSTNNPNPNINTSPTLIGGSLAANAAAAVAPRQQDQGECLTNIWGVIIRVPVDVLGVENESKVVVSAADSQIAQSGGGNGNLPPLAQQPILYATSLNVPTPPFCIDDTAAVQQYAIHKVHKTNPKVLCREYYHVGTCPKGHRCDGMHIDRLYVANMLATARVTAIVVVAQQQGGINGNITVSASENNNNSNNIVNDSRENSGAIPSQLEGIQDLNNNSNNNNNNGNPYKSAPSPNTYRIKMNDCCTLDGCIFSRLTLGNNSNPMSPSGKNCNTLTNHNAWQLSTLGPIFVPELQLTVPLERLSITRGYLKSIRSASPQALASAVTNPNAGMIVNPAVPPPSIAAGLTTSAAAQAATGSVGGSGVTVCNTFDSRPVPLCQAHIYNPNGCPNGKECQSLHVCRQLVLQVRKLQQEQQQLTNQLNQLSQNNNNNNNNQQSRMNNSGNNNNNNQYSNNNFGFADQQQQQQQQNLGQFGNNNNNSRMTNLHNSPNFIGGGNVLQQQQMIGK